MRLKKLTMRAAKRAIRELLFAIECLTDTPIPTLQTPGATLESWKDEIGRIVALHEDRLDHRSASGSSAD